MVALSIMGLSWCQHAGWTVVLYDGRRRRRLQITLRLEDALTVGQELSGHRTDQTDLYQLVGAVIKRQPDLASVTLGHGGRNRASTALFVHTDEGPVRYPTSTAVGVVLAVRAGLPIVADEALMEACGVADEPEPRAHGEPPEGTPIPRAFHLALVDPPEPESY